jgi:hypothetical protein
MIIAIEPARCGHGVRLLQSAKKPHKFPEYGSDKIVNILYGLPNFTSPLRQEIQDHEMIR